MENTNESPHIVIYKIIFLIGILTITLIFGLVPYYSKFLRSSTKFLGISNAFSGGIFIGIALFHLLPEAGEKFDAYFKTVESKYSKYPNQYFIAFLSYSLILFVEKVAFDSHTHLTHSHIEDESQGKRELDDKFVMQDNKNQHPLIFNENDSTENEEDVIETEIKQAISTRGKFTSFMQQRSIFQSKISDSKIKNHETFKTNNSNEFYQEIPNLKDDQSSFTPYVLLLSLSLHGFFEGIGLGLQSTFQSAFYLFIAIIAHKWAEAFTLGISFHKSKTVKSLFLQLIGIFSIVTPLGIILGLILSESSPLIEAIFLSLSTGTFIYVSASEVIVEEFAITRYKYSKFIFFILGGVFIGFLAVLEKDNENIQ